MIKVDKKDARTTSLTSFGSLYYKLYKHCSGVSIVNFEEVNVDCVSVSFWIKVFICY